MKKWILPVVIGILLMLGNIKNVNATTCTYYFSNDWSMAFTDDDDASSGRYCMHNGVKTDECSNTEDTSYGIDRATFEQESNVSISILKQMSDSKTCPALYYYHGTSESDNKACTTTDCLNRYFITLENKSGYTKARTVTKAESTSGSHENIDKGQSNKGENTTEGNKTENMVHGCYYGITTIQVRGEIERGRLTLYSNNGSKIGEYGQATSCGEIVWCRKGTSEVAYWNNSDNQAEIDKKTADGYNCNTLFTKKEEDFNKIDENGNHVPGYGNIEGPEHYDIGTEEVLSCKEVLGNAIKYVEMGFSIIQIAAPILLIVLGSVDLAGAVIASDNDALKKATSKLGKRAIAAVAIFFVPMLVKLLIGMTGLNIPDVACGLAYLYKGGIL